MRRRRRYNSPSRRMRYGCVNFPRRIRFRIPPKLLNYVFSLYVLSNIISVFSSLIVPDSSPPTRPVLASPAVSSALVLSMAQVPSVMHSLLIIKGVLG